MKKLVPTDAVLVPDQAKKVFEGEIFDVYQWPQKLFDGSEATFEMLKRPDTVSAICIVDGKILVLDEEQPHSGRKLSFPGGRVDLTDESVLKAAQREVHEETGYSFQDWRLILVKQMHTKIEWFIHIFLAQNPTSQEKPHIDAGEKIDVKFFSFDEVKNFAEQKIKYVGESEEIFEDLVDLEGLISFPQYKGQQVDR